jgi:uncharacterized protein YjbI with pentapeptide repeats
MPEPIAAYWEAFPVWITFGLAILAALLLAIGIWWLWWSLPKREVARLSLKIRDAKARADVEDNLRKTVGQALGGIAVLLGAGLAYLQFSQQQRASHDLLISNQVSKGFEQLGSEKVVVRLGGIYALEGVMNNSDQYHQPVLEALTAFVRESTKLPVSQPAPGQPTQGPPTDIQAALTVIGRRAAGHGVVDLTEANIAGANLSRAHLAAANLTHADLTDANLTGANLTSAELTRANLTSADLISANLTDANLYGAVLDGVDLSYANLTQAHLISANLTDANIADVNLTGAYLAGANLTHADLTGANMTDTHLDGANLAHAEIDQSQLDRACGFAPVLPTGLTLKRCPASPSH